MEEFKLLLLDVSLHDHTRDDWRRVLSEGTTTLSVIFTICSLS